MARSCTPAEGQELDELLDKHERKIWGLVLHRCGGEAKRPAAEEIHSKVLMRIAEGEPEWADWFAVKAAGKTFMYFVRGVLMRVLSTEMKRAKRDPHDHFPGQMTAEMYADSHFKSPEQTASDNDIFAKVRAELVKQSDELAVQYLDLYAENVTDNDEIAERLGVDKTEVYRAAARVKLVGRALFAGDEL